MQADKPKVLITGMFKGNYREDYLQPLDDIAGVEDISASDGEEELLKTKIKDADVLILGGVTLQANEVLFSQTDRLRAVVRWGKGFDNVDVDAATRHGVMVSIQGDFEICVAEAAVLLMLALSKKLMKQVHAAKNGIPVNDSFRGVNLSEKKLGIVGLGIIGIETARICQAIGMKVIAFDPYCEEQRAAALGVELVRFDALLDGSDFISISCNYTPETHHLFDKKAFELMKTSAFIVNTARGSIVDEAALTEALQSNAIAGAGLDVVEKEPIDTASPLLSMENVIITPHALAVTLDARRKVAEGVLDSTVRILQNKKPKHLVNPDVAVRNS